MLVRKNVLHSRWAAIGGLAVIAVGAIAGCSSSGGKTNSDGTTNITIAYAATGAGFSDLYTGIDQGFFKAHGLNVTIKQVTPQELVPGILSGSVQLGGGVADGTASSILQGEKLKYVALTEGNYNLQLWANKNITSVGDLTGKSIALTTQGSETDFAVDNFLSANKLAQNALSKKFLTTTPQMISAMTSGAVDAGLFQPPTAQILLKSGFHVLSSLSNLKYAVGAYVSTSSYATAHPKVMSDFLAAEQESLTYMHSHPAQTEASIQKHSGDASAADAKVAYNFFIHVWKTDPNVDSSLIQAAFVRAAGKVNKTAPSDVSQYIYTAAS